MTPQSPAGVKAKSSRLAKKGSRVAAQAQPKTGARAHHLFPVPSKAFDGKAKRPATLPVLSLSGQSVGEAALAKEVFDGRVNRTLLEQVRIWYGWNQRQGTHATKTRGEVSGGGKKPWKQKGTGNARAGSIRSPLWRKGGTVFGPHPRSYEVQIPHRMRLGALRSALNDKWMRDDLVVVKDFALDAPKTSKMIQALNAIGSGERPLLVQDKQDPLVWRSARNIRGVGVSTSAEINAYVLARHKKLVVTEKALVDVQTRLKQSVPAPAKTPRPKPTRSPKKEGV